MNRRLLLSILILIILFFSVGGHFINKYYHNYIKSHPQMYCYEYFRGNDKPISVLIIESLKLKKAYLQYYNDLQNGIEPILDNSIPLKGLPQYAPVFVIEYTKDSLLAKVVSYYDRGSKFGRNFTKGWVYSKTLHRTPPVKNN